jgi:hypothetical protein
MRGHYEETPGRAALLLEGAAYASLRVAPAPASRKAAFHLVLAGLRYNAARQRRLAMHCYMQVRLGLVVGVCGWCGGSEEGRA